MGINNKYVFPFYKEKINLIKPPVALLGFSNNCFLEGDLYDLSLNNWNINSEWKLKQKYNTIICTRCSYFAKDPEDFIKRCYDNLIDDGLLYVDWGLGDHWRFPEFKVGWIKNNKQEYAYGNDNYLWSTIWNDDFLDNKECIVFEKEIIKRGYLSLNDAIIKEVPSILNTAFIENLFEVKYDFLTLVEPYLQLYIMVSGIKK